MQPLGQIRAGLESNVLGGKPDGDAAAARDLAVATSPPFLLCRPESAAQTMTVVRNPG